MYINKVKEPDFLLGFFVLLKIGSLGLEIVDGLVQIEGAKVQIGI
jgi:hypothetical protein